jgi:hypothetical protein
MLHYFFKLFYFRLILNHSLLLLLLLLLFYKIILISCLDREFDRLTWFDTSFLLFFLIFSFNFDNSPFFLICYFFIYLFYKMQLIQ